MNAIQLFNSTNFLLATRDSGYKSFSSAVAELLDNSFEANATKVEINFTNKNSNYCIEIIDNGCGMDKNVMKIALQFGGSTRFSSRIATGRYGMGLPNSSLSHSKRVDVYSWRKETEIWWNYLDLDEIVNEKKLNLPNPTKINSQNIDISSPSGTIVKWSKCDRLKYKHEKNLKRELIFEIGKIFRKQILMGKTILINGEIVKSFDPTFYNEGINLNGSQMYGKPLVYDIKLDELPNSQTNSKVEITFTILPIEKWYLFSNEEKFKQGITKKAGVSIIRAGREIDYGWFFMGLKRKENYDDWWRCEINFEPYLDELFGVTHTKQEIHPTERLNDILSPDIEAIAHMLNRNVRERFLQMFF